MGKVKISDIAKEANVSISTVSNYLNERYENMSEETKKKIRVIIEKYNYSPSLGARRLSQKSNSKTLCIIIPRNIKYVFTTLFFAEIMQGIGDSVDKLGYRTILFTSQGGNTNGDIQYLQGLGDSLVDGFLIFDVQEHDIYIEKLEEAGLPYMCFGKYESKYPKYVATDHEDGAYKATKHFIFHGHKKISLIVSGKESIVTKQKLDGYLRALKESNIPFDERLVIYSKGDIEDIYSPCSDLIESNDPPTAFYLNHGHIYELLKCITDHGKKIPQDFGVILSDYFPSNSKNDLDYTYIKTPVYEVGFDGVVKLIDLINSKNMKVATRELLPIELVKGITCGCKNNVD